ncbi:putative Two-component sensor histidine kinase [Magnetospirillum sp. XM-1]|uniref:sensor histidine kinase n=1 Tax=Magnetospirillum sp. XM-1 TaxID=1663591 RepID=UPI00073E0F5E|nr:sensor histidine kinase [Magnetospirillum sp. XM-1]CUW40333.1 putative Two-component sensor histidine kinase [Magnetospirillum sp. XM-1]
MVTGTEASATPSLRPSTIARRWALALITVLVVIAAIHLKAAWNRANSNAERLLTALTRTLEHQVDTSLRSIDNLLLEASQRVDPARWPDPSLVQWFQSRLGAFPEIRQMVVFGQDGKNSGIILQANGILNFPVDISDREHFQDHVGNPRSNTLNIGVPVLSRIDNHPTIPLSRAIVDTEGRFKGVVSAAFDPMFLVEVLEKLLIEEPGGISVIRRDGIFLARLPEPETSLGRSTAMSPLFQKYLPQAPSGVVRFVSVTDGNAKIVSYGTLERYPVVATIGVTQATAFAEFHREAAWVAAVVITLSAALFWLATLSDRREYSRRLLAASLERQSHVLEEQVAERTRHLRITQAAAEEKARQLAVANADLEQFTHVAAHDLQEPLRSITSFVQLLQHRYRNRLDVEANEFIDYTVAGTKRMQQQLLDLLAYSQIRSRGNIFVPVDMNSVAAEAGNLLAGEIGRYGATLHVGDLPTLTADREQMVTLFENLIANAVKYHRPDHPSAVDVGAEIDEVSGGWTFWVRDDGIGIEPQYAERIFTIFQKLHGREEDEGTGIGLAICKRIVERHGGRIWVEPSPGGGATFRFTLPTIPPGE